VAAESRALAELRRSKEWPVDRYLVETAFTLLAAIVVAFILLILAGAWKSADQAD
jgi:hypothetical protein